MEAFVWITRLGSFRAAAEKLSITQAAISNRISSLEQDFNTRLFDRDAREIRLTFDGRLLLGYAERMLELSREMSSIGRTGANIAGVVRIGVIETIVHTWLINFLRRVQEMYPGIELQLTSESTRRLHEQLRQGELDLALQTDSVIGDGIRNTPGGSIAMGWVGRAADWPAEMPPVTLAQLARLPIFTMNRGSQPHCALIQLCEAEGVPTPRIHCVSSISAIVRLAQAGFGIAVLPLAPARDAISNGVLRVIPCTSPLTPQRLMVSYSADLTTEAIQLVAKLACEEAALFARNLEPEYGFNAGMAEAAHAENKTDRSQ
ncbi:LysR family transcriptional regulator [Collimonas arenae]|uniref:LysR family transcriptional regulator n=1 Tax=Collimonas arenae TaxID=279058 RepID=UPI002646E850|nr:LysR family transcriptional regulator [Collimonas arenae]